MHRIHDCVDTLKRYYPDAIRIWYIRAYSFCRQNASGQTRLSGEPYLSLRSRPHESGQYVK
jgi:(p)ppGpp synthase/HD superfamily hydrolase